MKKLFLIIAAVFLMAACSEDVSTTGSVNSNISFSVIEADMVSVQTQNAPTRTNTISSVDCNTVSGLVEDAVTSEIVKVDTDYPTDEPLFLTITDEPYIHKSLDTEITRGSLINAVDAASLSFGVTELRGTTIYINNNNPTWESTLDAGTHQELFKASATWEYNAYEGTTYDFYAYAPYIENDHDHGMTLSNYNRTITYDPTYSTGIAASNQPDLMTARMFSSAYVGAVPLTFQHRLCAVQIKTASTWGAAGYKISGIQFHNIYYQGTFDIDTDKDAVWKSYNENEATPGDKGDYTATGFVANVSTANTVVAGNATTWLMMVPQTLSGAKLSITLQSTSDASKTFTMTAPINNSVWRAGHTITYTVSPESIGSISVSYPSGARAWSGTENGPVTSYDNGQSFGLFVVDKDYKIIISNQQVTAASASATPNLTISSPIFLSKQYRYFLMYPYSTTATGLAGRALNTVLTADVVASADAFFETIISNWTPIANQSTLPSWKAQDLQVAMLSGTSFPMVHKMGLANIKMSAATAAGSKETLTLSGNTTTTSYSSTTSNGAFYALDEFVTNLPYKVGSRNTAGLNCYFIVNPANTYTFSTSYQYSNSDSYRQWNNIIISPSSNTIARGNYGVITTSVPKFKNLGKLYSHSKTAQTFQAVVKGKHLFECWGAAGGNGMQEGTVYTNYQSLGGYVKGTLDIASTSTTYFLAVGSKGASAINQGIAAGGWPGGGSGYPDQADNESGAGGGGFSAVYTETFDQSTATNFAKLKTRIMVAGAGGGCTMSGTANSNFYGAGGGLSGISSVWGTAGTQNSGYSFGVGGNASSYGGTGKGTDTGTGGGGGGYWGGRAAANSTSTIYGSGENNGGGGSSFVSGLTGCRAITSGSTSSSISYRTDKPTVHYSNIEFSSPATIAGNAAVPDPSAQTGNLTAGNTGNGYIRITCKPYD